MAQVSKYRYLLNQYPETVQKEQFRIICHISKRTARYLLQSGLVPCVQSGKKTRNYTIKMKDIVRYLERREIHPEKYKLPPGSYSGTYAVKPLLPESVTTEELRKYYIESFRDIPDIVSTREAAELTGATASTVAKWIRTKKLKALSHGPAFIIPKVNLIDFTKAGSSCPCRSAWYWCAPSPAASQCQSAPSKGSGAAPRETEGHAGTPSGSFGCCSSRRLSASPLMFPGFLPVSAPVPLCPSSF